MIPTAFVVVSFSRPAMNKLFSTGATFKDLLKESETNEDVFLFNNSGNANFIKLEHVFDKKNLIKLELIDPQQEFEQRIITLNIADLASAYQGKQQIKDKSPIDFTNENEYREKLQENKQFFQEYTEKLQKKKLQKAFQLYIAYGVGENLASWSGPHITSIQNIDISLKGSRKFTLEMQPPGNRLNLSDRKILTRSDFDMSLDGLKAKIIANSSPFNFFDYANNLYFNQPRKGKVYDPYIGSQNFDYAISKEQKGFINDYANWLEEATESKFLRAGYNRAFKVIKEIDVHLVITECIKNYIQTATGNPNVLVLLPNLNELLIEYINDKTTQSMDSYELPGASTSMFLGLANTAITLEREAASLLKLYKACKYIFGGLGLTMKTKFKDFRKSTNPNILTEEDRNFEDVKQRALNFLEKRDFYVSLSSEYDGSYKSIDAQAKLSGLLETIKGACKGTRDVDNYYKTWEMATYFETDSKFIELWAQEAERGNPVFYNGSINFDPDSPVIIYGDSALIHNMLYVEDREEITYEGPVHPLDAVGLGRNYKRKAKDITDARLDAAVGGPFGETTFVPDEFMFMDENLQATKALKKIVKDKRLSVFRYNVQNPNVLDIQLNFSPIYFSDLKGKHVKEIKKRAVNVVGGLLDSRYSLFELPTLNTVTAYIRARHNALGNTAAARDAILEELETKDLSKLLEGDTAEENAKLAYAKYEEILNDPKQPLIKVDQNLPGDPITLVSDMSERLYRKALQLSINTLPSFHLCGFSPLKRPILLIASDRPIKQTSPPDQSILDTFFSGLYLIYGYKHTIASGKASSEFHLQRMITPSKSKEEPAQDDYELKEDN